MPSGGVVKGKANGFSVYVVCSPKLNQDSKTPEKVDERILGTSEQTKSDE